jgi:RHS repeat-associated protein
MKLKMFFKGVSQQMALSPRNCWFALFAVLALSMAPDGLAQAVPCTFSYFVGSGISGDGTVPYQISFADFSKNGMVGGYCGVGGGDSGGGPVDLSPGAAYTCNANIEDSAFCTVFLSVGAPCGYDVYMNGIKGAAFSAGYEVGEPGTSFAPTFSIRPNGFSVPIAEWDASVLDNGHYTLTPDGMSQAYGAVINTSSQVTFAFVGDSLGCTLTNTGSSATLTAGTNYGTVEIVAETTNAVDCLITNFYFDLCGCPSCSSGTCPSQPCNNSVDIRINLGPSALGGNFFLEAESQNPDPALGTPASLKCNYSRPDLVITTNSLGLQQVVTSDRIIEVATNSASSYSLLFYRPDEDTNVSSGIFYFGTNAPFDTATIELVGGDTNHVEYSDSLSGSVADYYWEGSGWSLVTGNGLKNDTLLTTNYGSTYTKTRLIKNASGGIDYQYTETWQTFPFGNRLIQKITGSGPGARTETYTYATNGLVQQANDSDGSWDIYTYDSLNRVTGHYSPFGNSVATTNLSLCRYTSYTYDDGVVSGSGDVGNLNLDTARQTVNCVLGQEVGRSYTVVQSGEIDQIQCTSPGAAWNDPGNLVTINSIHTDGEYYGKPSEILNPDGTEQDFAYIDNSSGTETVTSTGAQGGSGVSDGTTVATYEDQFGHVTLTEQTDIASGILLSAQTNSYDAFGHLTNTAYLDGTSVQQSYDCCNPETRVDRDGTVTSYAYDALNRLQTTLQNGIVSSNSYNANGDVTSVVRYGTDGSLITNSASVYNDSGELISSVDGLGNTTYYTNYLTPNGNVSITTNPDSTTRIETNNLDGSAQSVTGTAVLGVRYVYGVEIPVGESVYRLYTKEIKLNADGSDSAEWTKTYTDMLGHAYKTVYPDGSASQSIYNSQGQLAEQIDPDGVTTLYQYNAKGQLAYTATDMNANGAIDFPGNDRITETISDVTSDNGVNVNRTRTYVWNIDNADSSNLVSQAETSVDGLDSWNVTFNNGIGITNFSTTSYSPAESMRVITSFAPDGSYDTTTYQYGRLISVMQYDANGEQIGGTTNGYDVQGRQNTVTDARNGTTTSYYNADGQVIATLTPSPDGIQAGQLTTNVLDSMGRAIQTINPDNTAVTNLYYTDGLLEETYGSRTYPVEYTYDYAGRMKTMTTWTNFAAATGAATTTWNYDPLRGFMTNKAYADGRGPIYSYTPAGRLRTRTWARGIMAIYSYDNAGELSTINYSDTTPAVTKSYDRLGRLVAVISGSMTDRMAYNDADQLLGETYSGGPLDGLSITNGYDQYLRRTNLVTQQSSNPLTQQFFGYDAASRLLTVSDGTNTAAYAYVGNSSLIGGISFSNNGVARMTTTRQYDYLNRLTQIQSSAGGSNVASFHYNYNIANQRTAVTNVDNSYWVYQYDNLGQVISGKKYWSDGTPVAGQQFTYNFDDIGNRQSTASGGDASGDNLRSANYTANNLNQYTSRDVPGYMDVLGGANSNATVTLWTQDAGGSPGQPGDPQGFFRTIRKNDYFRGEISFNNSTGAVWLNITNLAVLTNGTSPDIIATNIGGDDVAQTPEVFQYDADGNLTNDGLFSYVWDAENRMVSITSLAGVPTNAAMQEAWSYLPDGRWSQVIVSKWNGMNYSSILTNDFLWDGQVLAAEVAPNNALIRSYMRGLDLSGTPQGAGGVGGLLEVSYYGSAPTNCFATFDGNGNVSALVNGVDGTIAANYEYDPFGQTIRQTGPMASVNPMRFSTQYADDNVKDIKYLYRAYLPSAGRWSNRDPIGEQGGLNQYAFVYNNFVNLVDGSGLEQVLIWVSAYIPDARFQFIYPDGFDPDAIFSGDGRTGPQIGGSSRAFHKLIIETDPDKSPIVMNTAGGNISTVYYKPGGGFPKLFFLSAIDAAPPYATVTRIKTGTDTITKVQIHAATSDPLISRFIQAPELHYDYTLDFTSCSKKLLVNGSHGHYPAFDMIIDTTAGQKVLLNYTPQGFDNGPWALKFAPMNVYLPLMDY